MRVRTVVFGVAVLLSITSAALAQGVPSPDPASPASPTQTLPAPTPGEPIETVPAPTPAPPGPIDSRPGYAPLRQPDQVISPPRPAAAPVVTPDQPSPQAPYTAVAAYGTASGEDKPSDSNGSAYIPVDSWVYPAVLRLYGMGYLDTMYLSMRPYTRRSVLHMLQASEDAILSSDNTEAQDILSSLLNELSDEGITDGAKRGTIFGLQSVYTRVQGITGNILQDSYHLGKTFFNDYGRPHESGFNNVTGFSTLNERGPFSLYVRGEYQHAPSSNAGYSLALANQLAILDETYPVAKPNFPQATIPTGPIAAQNPFRLVEATLSYHFFGHEISAGKSDAWLGPGMGGAMSWSNNAENIYSVRINRVEPLSIPLLSRVLGPVRYDFFYGSLKGHTAPNDDWVHSEMFAFQPTKNFQFGFQRTIIFGGKGHEPVTLHTFFKGFFDFNDTNVSEKFSRNDPGARFTAFNFSYRLPLVRHYLTLYADSEAHDDVTPVSAPRRAAYRPGIYLSHFPGASHLDLRVEGVSTDCSTLICQGGGHQYIEVSVQKQGYTSKGNILGDWIGREAKGGQAWLTYHLSGNEWVQLSYLNKKTPKDFIAGGTTQNQFTVNVVKRITPMVELNAWYQYEGWKAPIYVAGKQNDNTFSFQLTWFPKLRTSP
ncbi:MAG: hypothetical protein NVSMB62_11540 [Acidobacteriaceae bacterium]